VKNFVVEIPIKFGVFYVIKTNLVQILSTSTPKYR